MRYFHYLALAVPLSVLTLGCGGPPAANARLAEAREAYEAARSEPRIALVAAAVMDEARQALSQAEALWERRGERADVDHYAYLARQRVRVAEELAALHEAERGLEQAQAEHQQAMLELRTAEADAARRAAEAAQAEAEAARRAAEQPPPRATPPARPPDGAGQLQGELTRRGLVVTLTGAHLDAGALTPAAAPTLRALADFLGRYPERQAQVEVLPAGAGSGEREGAQRLADAVRTALVDRGVAAERIRTVAYEAPVGNAGPRVEVVISDGSGHVPPRK